MLYIYCIIICNYIYIHILHKPFRRLVRGRYILLILLNNIFYANYLIFTCEFLVLFLFDVDLFSNIETIVLPSKGP